MAERTCSFPGCPKKVVARGWCGTHYHRWRRNGTVEIVRLTTAERFWAKVNKNGPVSEHRPDLGPCWLWTAATIAGDYGQFDHGTAHAWSYVETNGPVPDGLELDHLCRVRLCVRVSHLEPVTRAENLRRGAGFSGVLYTPVARCRQGHEYVDGSYFVDNQGTRRCFICHKAAQARYRAKQRAT